MAVGWSSEAVRKKEVAEASKPNDCKTFPWGHSGRGLGGKLEVTQKSLGTTGTKT